LFFPSLLSKPAISELPRPSPETRRRPSSLAERPATTPPSSIQSPLPSPSGGTFALYSLLCQHAKVNTIPNKHRTDEELTTYSRHTFDEKSLAAKVKRWLEADPYKKNALLVLVLIGTFLSASGGIKVDHPGMSNDLMFILRFKERHCFHLSSSYHGSFHQWFTLYYGAPPSPSYHGSFYQRFIFPHPPPPSATGFGQVVGEQNYSDADGDNLETHLVDD
ncbi:hypothetical protein Taro_026982, partial [Colocasia esculenta]|nr:hypothetical protein [Colocasia esculenta]